MKKKQEKKAKTKRNKQDTTLINNNARKKEIAALMTEIYALRRAIYFLGGCGYNMWGDVRADLESILEKHIR